jgi:hypothetical protein
MLLSQLNYVGRILNGANTDSADGGRQGAMALARRADGYRLEFVDFLSSLSPFCGKLPGPEVLPY